MAIQKKGSMTIQEKLDRQKGINPPVIASQAAISEKVRKKIITERHRAPLTSAQGAISEKVRRKIITERHRVPLTSAQGAISERVRKNIILARQG